MPILAVALVVAAALVAGCEATHVVRPATQATQLPPNYRVEYDSLFQTPRYIANSEASGGARPGEPAPFSDAQAFQIVRGFVMRYAAVFRLRPGIDDFVMVHASGSDGANVANIQQTYRSLPVAAMGYGTMVIANGSVGSMIGHFMPNISVSTFPIVGSETATARSIAALAPTVVTVISAPHLMIDTSSGSPRLAWSTIVMEQSLLSWTVLVDARYGSVLAVNPNFILN